MAGQVFGLDFGTTNSVLSVIDSTATDRRETVHHLTDEGSDRPHPSVIWYRGSEIIVGRKAREQLDAGSEAIVGSFVRSPKRLLDQDAPVHVDGRDLDPRDVIAEVLRFLRHDAASRTDTSRSVERAVMTIPVRLDGAGRRRLREAARKAEIGVVQFVHEPLAALYAYLRSKPDYRRRLAELDQARVLVFDWGGGTLDLTLCQIQGDQIVQIANLGDNEVGGDRFDELVRNRVRERHARQHGLDDIAGHERDEARTKLLNNCELAKIQLSQRDNFTVFVSNYLRREGIERDLSVNISRSELDAWTAELVQQGLGAIDSLLEDNRLTYHQIALCLPTGGMVNMPAIRNGLIERFGDRAPRIANGDRIISEGAAWIAHDDLRLGLAKPIELLQPDDTYAAVIPLPFELPVENQVISLPKSIYHCVDPRSGRATFQFARPSRPRPRDARSDRQSYTTMLLHVDEEAPPLMERLELQISIDHDYVARVDLASTMRKDHIHAEIYDLEFTLRFRPPTGGVRLSHSGHSEQKLSVSDGHSALPANLSERVRLRSNVFRDHSWLMVPGDLIVQYKDSWFDDRAREYSDWQKAERDYYKDCPFCHESRYEYRMKGCNYSHCLWRRAYPRVVPEGLENRDK